MITVKDARKTEVRENVRGGTGALKFGHLFDQAELLSKCNVCAEIEMPPSSSIGAHPHGPDAELYFILEGEITVTDDGVKKVLKAGDAVFTGDGKTHSAVNESDRPAKMLAVVVK